MIRRELSYTLYPFTPDAQPYRAQVAGLVDCLFTISGPPAPSFFDQSSSSSSSSTSSRSSASSASSLSSSSHTNSSASTSGSESSSDSSASSASGSSNSSSSQSSESSSSSSSSGPIHKSHYCILKSIEVRGKDNIYTFWASAEPFANSRAGNWHQLVFKVLRGSGMVRADDENGSFSFLLADSDRLYPTPGLIDNLWIEVEPCRLVWRLDEVRSIRLVNEYRDHDPVTRSASIAANPDETVLYVSATQPVLRLADGYNCSVGYDPDRQTLTIDAGAGLGRGLPTGMPWDTSPVDIFTGIRSINGVNDSGRVNVEFKESVVPVYGTNSIDMAVQE